MQVQWGRYPNGRVALQLVDEEGPVATATVNVPEAELAADEVWINDYAENVGVLHLLVLMGVVEPTGRRIPTGFVDVPVARLPAGKRSLIRHWPGFVWRAVEEDFRCPEPAGPVTPSPLAGPLTALVCPDPGCGCDILSTPPVADLLAEPTACPYRDRPMTLSAGPTPGTPSATDAMDLPRIRSWTSTRECIPKSRPQCLCSWSRLFSAQTARPGAHLVQGRPRHPPRCRTRFSPCVMTRMGSDGWGEMHHVVGVVMRIHLERKLRFRHDFEVRWKPDPATRARHHNGVHRGILSFPGVLQRTSPRQAGGSRIPWA